MKRSGSSKPRVHVVWDEQNLDVLEANKTPKQKITEPKTPYYAPEAENGFVSPSPTNEPQMADVDHAEAVRIALGIVASTSEPGTSEPRNSGWTTSEDEAEEMDHDNEGPETNGQSWSFEEHRRAHYCPEYRKAKELAGYEVSDEEAEMGGRVDGERHIAGSSCIQSQQDHESSLSRSLGGIDLQAAEM